MPRQFRESYAATRSGYVEYRPLTAQWHAERRARRPKISKLANNKALKEYVEDRLSGAIRNGRGKRLGPQLAWRHRRHGPRQDRHWAKAWSPQQIANRLRVDFPDDDSMRISHEAIYRNLYIHGRGLNHELSASLRLGRPLRVPRARSRGRGKNFVTPDVMIGMRPPEVEQRVVPGHWEGDLIIGVGSSAIGTLVERTSRFTMLVHLPRMNEQRLRRGTDAPALPP